MFQWTEMFYKKVKVQIEFQAFEYSLQREQLYFGFIVS